MKEVWIVTVTVILGTAKAGAQDNLTLNHRDDGYRGIWYSNQPSGDEYVYKYSGGLATYPANHYPFSVYVRAVNKTFFCYGGTDREGKTLLHAVSYFDHTTGMVPRPTIVLDKQTDNAHDNPVMNVDKNGYIWIFSTANGTQRPSFIHRSKRPYDIAEFERIHATKQQGGRPVPLDNFSYLQSWYHPEHGFLSLFTHYDYGVIPGKPDKPRRTISYMASEDGITYGEWKDLALIEEGHYQTSGSFRGGKIGTVFNYHPLTAGENGLNFRTNLYYLETIDHGRTWQTAGGTRATLPFAHKDNAALVKDYRSSGLNVYINDLAYDGNGYPVVLYLTSKGFESGPDNGPRAWNTARYEPASGWMIRPVTHSGNNYDMGSLYIDSKGVWRIVAPTATGPQPFNTGGEMVMWTSSDQGKTWTQKQLTRNSKHNHSYARRPVQVHDGFYAFWADGHGRQRSVSHLYFCDIQGNVYRLPPDMKADMVKPERIR